VNIYLVRHTTPQVPPGVCYGSTDLDLAETFAEECERIRGLIPAGIQTVYSSPLQRCARLASALSPHPVVHDDRLREIHFGDWEMQEWETIPLEQRQYFFDDFATRQPPGGESFGQVQARALEAFDDYIARHADDLETLLVVAHAGVIRSLLAHWENRPLLEAYDHELDYGAVSLLEVRETQVIPRWVNR
jgi:alpha-ribazole phosphatase